MQNKEIFVKKEGEKRGDGDEKSQKRSLSLWIVSCRVSEKELAALGTGLKVLPRKMPRSVMRMIESVMCIIGLLYGLFFLKLLFPFR